MKRSIWVAMLTLLAIGTQAVEVSAQQRAGEVAGFLSANGNKYKGEFDDDSWGFGGAISLQYAAMNRLLLEARVGLGEIRWGITPSDIERYPNYFGQQAVIGDNYPGTNTQIEKENESRISTFDVLVHYVIVDGIPAVPFITAGVGLVNFAPSTSEAHEALPNFATGVYSGSAFSVPVGGGVRIPFSSRVGLMLRGEYRFVFSPYLDDLSENGSNDAITSLSVGLTYAFTPGVQRRHHHRHHHHHHHHGRFDEECCYEDDIDENGTDWRSDEERAEQSDTTSDPGKAAIGAPGADSTKTQADTNAKATPTTPPPADTAKSAPPKQSVDIAPCPSGTGRFCVADNESVCAIEVTPGAERIRWEDAFVYEASSRNHKQTLRQANETAPCFDAVVRQTANSYYLCTECCFERVDVGGQVQYRVIGDGEISKGAGTFSPVNCPDCKTVVEQGR